MARSYSSYLIKEKHSTSSSARLAQTLFSQVF